MNFSVDVSWLTVDKFDGLDNNGNSCLTVIGLK